MKSVPDHPQWRDVPKGTPVSACKGKDCGAPIYWTEQPRKNKPGTSRIPVDCDVDGGQSPDSLQDGKGVSHFQTCPNAGDF